MLMTATAKSAQVLLCTALLAGCASTGGTAGPATTGPSIAGSGSPGSAPTATPSGGSGSARPSALSGTAPPTRRPPNRPPRTPSDLISGDWLVGTVSTDGSGPCYGLVTDDGEAYALHSDAGTTLRRGTRVRARIGPLRLRIDCGPGRQASLLTVEPIR